MAAPMLQAFAIDGRAAATLGGRLPFVRGGHVGVTLRKPLTFLVGENGSGKTTLLEALAAACSIRPGGGGSYGEVDVDRDATVLSGHVTVRTGDGRRPPPGYFMRADKLNEALTAAGRVRGLSGGWRDAASQSRGESVLSLLSEKVDGSEGRLYLLDEPETGLSPDRQIALLLVLDEIARDGRSQALVATHSPILMSHPSSDILWIDETGIEGRDLDEVPHWTTSRRFMRDPETYFRHLFRGG